MKNRWLKQRKIGAHHGIKQPDVSYLMYGHFKRFTTHKLLGLLMRLEREVTIQISRRHYGEPYQEVGFVL